MNARQKKHVLILASMAVMCLLPIKLSAKQSLQSPADKATRGFPAPVWDIPWSITRTRPGYPLLKNAKHFVIQAAREEDGAYHHHPQLTVFQERFFATWSNHPLGEDGPGQRVLLAHSNNGEKWTKPQELFSPVDKIGKPYDQGRGLVPINFVTIEKRLFAVAEIFENVGFGTRKSRIYDAPDSRVKTDQFPKKLRKGLGRVAREIKPDGSFGKAFWLKRAVDFNPAAFGFEPAAKVIPAKLEANINRHFSAPITTPNWAFGKDGTEYVAGDGSYCCEPTSTRLPDKSIARYLRQLGDSQRLYVQFSRDEGKTWSEAVKTPIPDAPSKSMIGRLANGNYFLIGNQVVSKRGTRRDPLTIGLSKNGTTFHDAYAIRWRTPKFRIPTSKEFHDGRGTGFQYPDYAFDEKFLWVIYSVNKEAIDVTRIPLEELKIANGANTRK